MSKVITYFKEAYDELVHKVTWPKISELQSSSLLVLVASLIFSLMIAGKRLPLSWKGVLAKLSPVLLTIVALLLIYRGVQLQIPADLRFWEATNFQPMCH